MKTVQAAMARWRGILGRGAAAVALLHLGACTMTHQTFTSGTDYQRPPKEQRSQFRPERDGFGFPNDTVREYIMDEKGKIVGRKRAADDVVDFSHSCFLVCRASLQFHRFAQFAPAEPKLTPEEYRPLLKELFKIPVWHTTRRAPKIVFPGYPNLFEFSNAHKELLMETIGSWRMTYVRVGNWRMGWPLPRAGQSLAARRLMLAIDRGSAECIFLSRFPSMNHAVIVYDYVPLPGGDVKFLLYDPNYAKVPTWLIYHAKERSFEIQERWYYNEGLVSVMRVYLSPLH